MGIEALQKPTLKKTGYGSSFWVISDIRECESSKDSSSQTVDLIPKACNSVNERKEWSNFISITSKFKKPEKNQFLREIHIGAIEPFNNVHHKFSIPEISFVK